MNLPCARKDGPSLFLPFQPNNCLSLTIMTLSKMTTLGN